MARSFDPFRHTPEQILERKQERRPRHYAEEIYKRVPPERRNEEINRQVPEHLREWVRDYIRDWEMRDKSREGQMRMGPFSK